MNTKTVREIAGEIWAEATQRQHVPSDALHSLRPEVLDALIDLTMGVLARYAGAQLVNDADMPVTPLPRKDL